MFHSTLKNKDINLLTVYAKKKESSKYTSLANYIVFPLGLAILFLGVYFGYFFANSSLETKITDTKKENTELAKSIVSNPNYARHEALLKSRSEEIRYKLIYNNLESYPALSQKTFDQMIIAAGADVHISTLNYTRESSGISLQVESKTATSTEEFVRRLKTLTAFSSIDYSGYTKVEKTNTTNAINNVLNTTEKVKEETETVYSATIFCLLSR